MSNPLDTPGVPFEIELMNPNPSSTRPKDGPKYRVSFEVLPEVHRLFMEAAESNLRLVGYLSVLGDTDEEPKRKLKIDTPHGAMWDWLLYKNLGFQYIPSVAVALEDVNEDESSDVHELMRRVFGVESLSMSVGPEEIYAKFAADERKQIKGVVETALRKAQE